MRDFELLTTYAKEKIETAETPMSLYMKAQRKKDAVDILLTVLVASFMLGIATQLTNSASVQSPAIKRVIQQDLVASRTNP